MSGTDDDDAEASRPLRSLTQGGDSSREERERIARDFQDFVAELRQRKAEALQQGQPLHPAPSSDEDWEEEAEHEALLEDDVQASSEADDSDDWDDDWDDLDD